MKTVPTFLSFDGKIFPNRAECEAYEAKQSDALVLGLRADKLAELLEGKDPVRAEAFERLGRRLAALRIERGGSKRVRKAKGTAPEAGVQAPQGSVASLEQEEAA